MKTLILASLLLLYSGACVARFQDCHAGACQCTFSQDSVKVSCSGGTMTKIPQQIPRNVTELTLENTKIPSLEPADFVNLTELIRLSFKNDTALRSIAPNTFASLHKLYSLDIYDCPSLKEMDDGALSGSFKNLGKLELIRCGLEKIPSFKNFNTKDALGDLDLSQNPFKEIEANAFRNVVAADVRLLNTGLTKIRNGAFVGAQIQKLVLKNNVFLTDIEKEAFEGVQGLEYLDLSQTKITSLPSHGINDIKELLIKNTYSLRKLPPTFHFNQLETAHLTYAHHCCAFQHPAKQNPQLFQQFEEAQRKVKEACEASSLAPPTSPLMNTGLPLTAEYYYKRRRRRRVKFSSQDWNRFEKFVDGFGDFPSDIGKFGDGNTETARPINPMDGFGELKSLSSTSGRDPWGEIANPSTTHNPGAQNPWGEPRPQPSKSPGSHVTGNHGNGHFGTGNYTVPVSHVITVQCGNGKLNKPKLYTNITCTPQPDAFNPCEDVMGDDWLRVVVWFVLLAALLGNFLVIIVLLHSRHKMSVSKFLMCNLAFADFMMGLYLLIVASYDLHTLGNYFNFAIEWQTEGGCQAAGFVTVFASELSVYTLSVITLERWYAISHAIHLTKRLHLRQASIIMSGGWVFALILAILPLVGVSAYGTTSICLPFETSGTEDLGYLLFILCFNGLAFIIICFCYINMYCKVSGSDSTARSSDATIAKKMALLVFTDFACWAPIAFFALTAVGGSPFIDITKSKILLVFFYPLNSCANPFLYAIFTKQFRKDFLNMLSRYGLCTKRAARLRASYTSNHLSVSQTKNSLAMQHIMHHPSDGSILTQYTTVDGHRSSIRTSPNSTPRDTPTTTPKTTPKSTPKSNPKVANGKLRSSSQSSATSDSSKKDSRKLSVVPESSQTSEENDVEVVIPKEKDCDQEELVPKSMDSPRESPIAKRIRSASDYGSGRHCRRSSSKEKCERKNTDTSLSSYINDGSDNSCAFLTGSNETIPECESEFIDKDDLNHNHHRSTSLDKESGFHSEFSPDSNDEGYNPLHRGSSDRESGFHSAEPTPLKSSLSREQFFYMLMKNPDSICNDTSV